MIRVMIVDDHEVVREGLLAALTRDPQMSVVGSFAKADQALREIVSVAADVALVDLRLPDMPGNELCRKLLERSPQTAVVILSTYLSERTVRDALQAGAVGYVAKAAGLPELRAAIHRAVEGTVMDVPETSSQIVEKLTSVLESRIRAGEPTPTPRQQKILELAATGLTDKEIGRRLFISKSTVRFHLQNLKTLFDARSKTDLIAKAIGAGHIEAAPES